MEKQIIMQDGVVQKPISLMSWKIIAASKGYCRTIKQSEYRNNMEVLQELLKEEVMVKEDLGYGDLYYWLITTTLEVCSSIQINNFFLYDIKDYFSKKLTYQTIEMSNGKRKKYDYSELTLSYEDLCNILLLKLYNLQIREEHNGKWIDLFVISTNDGKLMSIKEAEDEWFKGKSNRKTLTKQ